MLLRVYANLVLIFCTTVVFSAVDVLFSNIKCAHFEYTNTTPSDSDYSYTETHNSSTHPITKDRLPIPWLADMFYQALSNFTIQNDVGSSACETQTKMYIENLRNNSYWAVKMYDSWSRYPIGILAGNTHQIGVYDECINVHQPVQGKYCMAGVKLGTMAGRDFELNNKDDLDTYDQAWNEILGCLLNGWFVSCILQLTVIGTVCTHVYVKNKIFGIGLISLLLCLSLILPFILTYTTRSYGILMINLLYFENPSSSYEFTHFYMPFYTRSIPYYIGLIAGILVEELREKKFILSKTQVYIWTFIIAVICFLVQSYSIVFYDRHRPYNVIEQATYSTLNHCTWPVILLWITICHFTSGYGPITRVISNQFLTVLGRLSYSVFLVNIVTVMILKHKQRTSITPVSEYGILFLEFSIVSTCEIYFTGLVLYLTVEAPFAIIIKKIFYGKET